MSAHTPGPWIVVKKWFAFDVKAESEIVAIVPSGDSVSLADARLIAAAPEMLFALQRIHAHGYTNGDDWDMVRDAITNATGVEPND